MFLNDGNKELWTKKIFLSANITCGAGLSLRGTVHSLLPCLVLGQWFHGYIVTLNHKILIPIIFCCHSTVLCVTDCLIQHCNISSLYQIYPGETSVTKAPHWSVSAGQLHSFLWCVCVCVCVAPHHSWAACAGVFVLPLWVDRELNYVQSLTLPLPQTVELKISVIYWEQI